MHQHHGWDLEYLDNMMPWERYIYVDMLEKHLIDLEKKRQEEEQQARADRAALERKLRSRKNGI